MSWTTTTLEELMFPADQWPDYITVGADGDEYSDNLGASTIIARGLA